MLIIMNNLENETYKKTLLESYLKQQQPIASTSSQIINRELVKVDNFEDISMDQFKELVKKWIEIDNGIKKATEIIKERKIVRDKLSQIISNFMFKYNIEDLNTKDGVKIRCKVSNVKKPINKNFITDKISEIFAEDEKKKDEIIKKIYEEERGVIQKVGLRRLKISNQ